MSDEEKRHRKKELETERKGIGSKKRKTEIIERNRGKKRTSSHEIYCSTRGKRLRVLKSTMVTSQSARHHSFLI